MNPNNQQLSSDPELLKGRYANNLRMGYSAEEFFLDFTLMGPNGEQHVSRVLISPGHLKRVSEYVAHNLKGYEQQHGGVIEKAKQPKKGIGFTVNE